MTAALRMLLAFLVLLPPGTFRKLDTLTRAERSRQVSVTRLHRTGAPLKSSQNRNPLLPERVRKWTDTTFLASSELLRVNDTCAEALPPCLMSLERSDSRPNEVRSREPAPSLNAHRSARGLLLAMGVLLV